MRIRTLALISAAVLSLAACGKKPDDTTTADNSAAAMETGNDASTVLAAAPASGGQTFANTAAASDAFEIESSKLAATNASAAKVKAFAKQMIAAHTGSTAKLKTIAASLTPAITPDPTLNADQQQKLADLKTATGSAFDSAYAADQVAAHQQALDGLNGYASTGDVPEFKSFASGLAPTVTAHLNMAKELK